MRVLNICIGVNSSPGQQPLRFAERDAYNIAHDFQGPLGMPIGECRLLLSAQATSAALLATCLHASARDVDVLRVYFSGHGSNTGLALADGELEFEDFATMLRLVGARHVVVILDTCHAAAAAPYFGVGGVGAILGEDTILRAWVSAFQRALPGIRLIFSVGRAEHSLEDARLRGGVFTHFLRRALRLASGSLAANGYSFVSDLDVFVRTTRLLLAAGYRQLPEAVGLNGDLPMGLSQVGHPVGPARFTHTFAGAEGLHVAVDTRLRHGFNTFLRWAVTSPFGKSFGTQMHQVSRALASRPIHLPYPHYQLHGDLDTQRLLRAWGAAEIYYQLQLIDEVGQVLDAHAVAVPIAARRVA